VTAEREQLDRPSRLGAGPTAGRVAVCRVEDLVEGVPTCVRVDGRSLAVVKWRSSIYALNNRCAHQGAQLCHGIVTARVAEGRLVGQPAVDPTAPTLACPWHGWEYDLRTGEVGLDPSKRVTTYRVSVLHGAVMVELPVRSDSGATDQRSGAPRSSS
jgi:nitrite reductase/ring-hydroxylating ferredoxin subunit